MPDAIPPALTPEEWEYVKGDPVYRALRMIEGGDDLSRARMTPDVVTGDAKIAHAVAALGNAALPDGDPRKITRADLAAVDDLRLAADQLATDYDSTPEHRAESERLRLAAERLRAKLAALLPPEDPPGG